MKAIFFIPKDSYMQARAKVLENDLLSRQSVVFRDNTSLGLPDPAYYLDIEGEEKAIEEARKVLKEIENTRELKGEEKEKVEKIIAGQEEKAQAGFGAIFG